MISVKTAMLLPGTGSDDVFVRSAFADSVTALGLDFHAASPRGGGHFIAGYLADLDSAAADGPIVAGGVSIGAHVAAQWAVRNPDRCAGLLLAMPAWSGAPDGAPAARLASASARLVTEHGVEEAIRTARAGAPGWLADELARAWRRYGADLAPSLAAAAAEPAPTLADLRTLAIPVGLACCTDDPVHPAPIAEDWAAALPIAAVIRTTLTALGADRAVLGRAAVTALRTADAASGANRFAPPSGPVPRSAQA